MWGLTREAPNGKFLNEGQYTISTAHNDRAYTLHMDFLSMSRCMPMEGTELWLLLNPQLYARIIKQGESQHGRVMLPVSQELHDRMLANVESTTSSSDCARYLRCFYVLGGSAHDLDFYHNSVQLIIILAKKNAVMGKKNAHDDNADKDSLVNQHIDSKHYDLIPLTLPLDGDNDFDDQGAAHLCYYRDPSLPFYKYLKQDFWSRDR
jgi:hypothetical protein